MSGLSPRIAMTRPPVGGRGAGGTDEYDSSTSNGASEIAGREPETVLVSSMSSSTYMIPEAPLSPEALLSDGELSCDVPLRCEPPSCEVEIGPVAGSG